MNTSQHLQHSDCPVYCFWNRYLLFSWLKNYFRKMDFSPTEVDYDKWIESAALNSQVTFQVAWYSHWAFLSSELIASEKWVANILLWLPSILFSLLKIVYRGLGGKHCSPYCLCVSGRVVALQPASKWFICRTRTKVHSSHWMPKKTHKKWKQTIAEYSWKTERSLWKCHQAESTQGRVEFK